MSCDNPKCQENGDPFKKGFKKGPECLCFTKAECDENGVIKLTEETRGALCVQAPLETPLTGCLKDKVDEEGNPLVGQAIVNAISDELETLKLAEDDTGTDDQTAGEVSTSTDNYNLLTGEDTQANLDEIDACLVDLKARVDNDTKYTLSAPIPDPNDPLICITTLSGTDGSEQQIIVNKPIPETDGVHVSGVSFDAATNIFTFATVNDADESPATPIDVDLSGLVSDPFTITGGNNVTVTYDVATGEYTIDAIDTDTDTNTTSTLVDNGDGTYTHTSGDGSAPVTIQGGAPDTNVSAVAITQTNPPNAAQDGISFTVGVTEDGNTVTSSAYTIPYASETTEGLIEIASTAVVAELNTCRPTDDTRAVSPVGMDFWTSRGNRFDSATVGGYTNACRRQVSVSVNGTASGDRSQVTASTSSTASGTMSMVAASNLGQANGGRSAVIASSSAQANATETFAGATSGALQLNAQGSASLGYRNTVATNAIDNGWSVMLGTADSVIGADGPAALYNFVLGGAQNSIDGNYSGSLGSTGSDINDLYCIIQNSSDCTIPNGSLRTNILSSRYVEAADPNTIVAGTGAGPATLSSNRTFQVDVATGDVKSAGAFIAGFVFAGLGEKAISAKKIAKGSAVVFEGLVGVRLAKKGERPDGITTKKLAICAGGGIDPDNSPFELDEDGQPIMVDETVEIKNEIIDREATQKAREKDENAEAVKKTIVSKELVRYRKVNKKYDSSKKVEVTCVEMLGRTFASISGDIAVGDYIGAGGVKVDADLGFRVLEVVGKRAFVLVK